jgi:hypothetical protein
MGCLRPGSAVVLPAHTPHVHWANQAITSLRYRVGALDIDYVDAGNNPRKH